jgi:hypothetical protein
VGKWSLPLTTPQSKSNQICRQLVSEWRNFTVASLNKIHLLVPERLKISPNSHCEDFENDFCCINCNESVFKTGDCWNVRIVHLITRERKTTGKFHQTSSRTNETEKQRNWEWCEEKYDWNDTSYQQPRKLH